MQYSHPPSPAWPVDLPCGSPSELQQLYWQCHFQTPQLPVADAPSQCSSFASASENSQADELLPLDSLLDLPLYNPTFSAPPSHTNGSRFHVPAPASTADQQLPNPYVATSPLRITHDSAFPAPFPPPSNPHLAPRTTLPTEVSTLLDDPITPTLINAQLSKPRLRTKHQPVHAHQQARSPAVAVPPARPIAKPRSNKLRPKEKIESLQQHLDDITGHIQHLTLSNDRLHRKQKVLGVFMQELAHIETVAAEIHIAMERHKADPSRPLEGAAALQNCTPQQFGEAYYDLTTLAGQSLMKWEASTACGGASPAGAFPAEVAKLQEAVNQFLHDAVCALHGRIDFIGRLMAQQLELFPGVISEEEHWNNVVASMDLTDEQVEDLLVAREVYLQYSDKVNREHDADVADLQQRTQQATRNTLQDADQILRLTTYVQKIHTLNIILAVLWLKHILNPVQAAKTIVRAYPLIPFSGMLMSNTLHGLCEAGLRRATPPGSPA